MTYRYTGHSRSDKQVYRTKEEVQEWKEHDPIPNFQTWLIDQGYLTQAEADQIVAKVEADIADSIAFAEASEEPHVENLLRDVYTEEPEVQANPEKVLPGWMRRTFGPATPISPPPGSREITC